MKQETKEVHKVLVPGHWVERVEEVFHIVLGVCLLGIAIAALYFSVARVFETSPFFPTGMIQSINDILFIIIILEILRTVVARYTDGAGGSIDNVPAQTPELLVTGDCPGTMYITAVDATPGGHVQIGSSALPGTRTVTGGPCAGVHLDLRRPAFRADLVANSYGIASTTIQATAPMCGALAIQALDVGSCQTTSVRYVPDPVVP